MKEVETWKGWYKYRVWLSTQLPLILSTTETIDCIEISAITAVYWKDTLRAATVCEYEHIF